MIIQETRSSSVMGIFRSSITLGSAVTTTVWSSAAMKAPSPVMLRMAQVDRIPAVTGGLTTENTEIIIFSMIAHISLCALWLIKTPAAALWSRAG